MRVFLTCVVLISIFFIGLVYGINYDKSTNQEVVEKVNVEEVVEEVNVNEVVVVEEQIHENHLAPETSTSETTSYSVASVLEALFSFLAETIVQVLYQFSKLFI